MKLNMILGITLIASLGFAAGTETGKAVKAETGTNLTTIVTNTATNMTKTPAESPDVIVTGTRLETTKARTGADITIVTAADIKKAGGKDVKEILRDKPGINVVQNGGFGATTAVNLRGLKSDATLVMIDGVIVNTPMTIGGKSFNFAQLPTDAVERIEVIKGPQSTLYGSDAMGGVINIITKKGKGKPVFTFGIEGGSYFSTKAMLDYAGVFDTLSFSATSTLFRTDGFSTAKVTNGAPDNDGMQSASTAAKLEWKPNDGLAFSGSFFYTFGSSGVDAGAFADDPNWVNESENASVNLAYRQRFSDMWEHRVSLQYLYNRADDIDPVDVLHPSNSSFSHLRGDNLRGDWQNTITFGDIDTITAGATAYAEWGSTVYEYYPDFFTGGYSKSEVSSKMLAVYGAYLQNMLNLGGMLFNTLGCRYDYSTVFGGAFTWKTALSGVVSNIGLTVRSSFGTGFKSPSIYQIYHPLYGNTRLTPEQSWAFDAGISETIGDKFLTVEATYFYSEMTNMIDYDFFVSKYTNKVRVISRGVEASLSITPIDMLTFFGSYTFTDSRNAATGTDSPRVPAHAASIGGNARLFDALNINAVLRFVGTRKNSDFDTVMLPQYYKLDCAVTYLIDRYEFMLRGENILNQQYSEANGYNAPGISIYGGVKVKL